MTAPAAALILRPLPKRDGVRDAAKPVRQPQASAQNPQATQGFAAHLERGTPPRPADRRSEIRPPADEAPKPKSAPTHLAKREAAARPEPATEAATGKTLPDTRQAPAKPATQTILVMLAARAATEGEEASADTVKSDVEGETVETAENAAQALPLQLPATVAAPALSSAPVQSRAAAPTKAGPSASPSPAPVVSPGRPAAAPATGTTDALTASPAATAPVPTTTVAAPAISFILERDAPVSGSPDTAAADAAPNADQPGPDQTAAKAQPSTLAALTGAATPNRTALRKARAEVETALPGLKSGTAEITASAFSLAQPATGPASAVSASAGPAAAAQPAEGIGFDALVDSIARARDGVADGAPVAVAMRHAEFGRISLRFHTDADGMSVAMSSPDPTFAPAVAAAHAAEAAAAANAEPAPRTAQTGTASGDATGSQMQGGARSGTGQRQDSPQPPRFASEPTRTAARGPEAPADDRQGGIFA